MKKFVKMMMVAAIAMTATVACSSDDKNEPEPPTPGATTIKVTVPAGELAKAGELQFTIAPKSDKDVVITIANSNDKALTVAKTVTIKANTVGVKTPIAPIADGEAVLTYTSEGVTFTPATSTIKTKAPVTPGVTYDPLMSSWGSYGTLVSVKVGETLVTLPNEYVDDFSANCHCPDMTSTKVAIKNGDKVVLTYDGSFAINGKEGTGAGDGYYLEAYADWNGNGKFEAATEKIGSKLIKPIGDSEATIEFTAAVPENAVASSRIRAVYANEEAYDFGDGAGTMDSGVFVDFTYTK